MSVKQMEKRNSRDQPRRYCSNEEGKGLTLRRVSKVRRKMLLNFSHFGGDHELTVWRIGMALEVVLVFLLGGIELSKRGEFRHDGVRPNLRRIQFIDDRLRDAMLSFMMIEDDGTVLRADVGALAVRGSGIMDGKKDVEQRPVRKRGRIKGDLNHLCMSCPSR